MKRALITMAPLLVLATACGGHAAASAGSPATTAPPARMSLAQACHVLRSDMVANGGMADKATLEKIAAKVTSNKLSSDAEQAENDVGNGDTWWINAAVMAHDCLKTGVQIPAGS